MELGRFKDSRRGYLGGYSGSGSGSSGLPYPTEEHQEKCTNCNYLAKLLVQECQKDYADQYACDFYNKRFKELCGLDIYYYTKDWNNDYKNKDFKKGTDVMKKKKKEEDN